MSALSVIQYHFFSAVKFLLGKRTLFLQLMQSVEFIDTVSLFGKNKTPNQGDEPTKPIRQFGGCSA
jgi:hypothetical protein